MEKVIMHLDMDAFFASIEQRDDPSIRNKPVIVGNSRRGVVSAASYEARKFGIHSAMPVSEAKRLCPEGVFLPVGMGKYAEASEEFMSVLEQFSPLVEKASIDEAYIDMTGTGRIFGPPEQSAQAIKDKIYKTTQLTCSIGVAPNKLLAKIASDWQKPGGLTVIKPDQVDAFMRQLPIGKIPGIGKKTQSSLQSYGIKMASDITRYPLSFWENRLGKRGKDMYLKALGEYSSPVVTRRDPKSCGAENTFSKDTLDREELKEWLLSQSQRVGRSLRKKGKKGKTITLKLKYQDFTSLTKQTGLMYPTNSTNRIYTTAVSLLETIHLEKKVRLIGISVSNFEEKKVQALLPLDEKACTRGLDEAVDRIQDKFGKQIIQLGWSTKKTRD